MSFEYTDIETAMAAKGLRMVVVGGVPSPWTEAAKGIFYVKGIDWSAVRLTYDDPRLVEWAGERTGPVAIYDDEKPRPGWAQILLLAERLAPTPPLLPQDVDARTLTFGLGHELLGEYGLAWTRRLQAIHAGLSENGGFPVHVAGYLAKKYGYRRDEADTFTPRVIDLLQYFSSLLHARKGEGRAYLQGTEPTAADIYLAAVMALFHPLPEERCAMDPATRTAFQWLDDETRAALDPILLEHRDRMYAEHLEPVLKL